MDFPSMSAVRFRITSCCIPLSVSGTRVEHGMFQNVKVSHCSVHSSTAYKRILQYPVTCMQLVTIIHCNENFGHAISTFLLGSLQRSLSSCEVAWVRAWIGRVHSGKSQTGRKRVPLCRACQALSHSMQVVVIRHRNEDLSVSVLSGNNVLTLQFLC